mgnify:CR=1 FL=1
MERVWFRVYRVRHRVLIGMLLALFTTAAVSGGLARRSGLEVFSRTMVDKRVVIDPGHGGIDSGSSGRHGTREKVVVLEISRYLKEFVEGAGGQVILTRTGDYDLSGLSGADAETVRRRKRLDLAKRVEIGNGSQADVYISIHANSIQSPRWHGAQTFYNAAKSPENKRLAENIQRELVRLTGQTRRKVSSRIQQYILENLEIPAVTVEVGFLSNPTEEELLSSPEYQRRVAWAIFHGLVRFFVESVEPAGG